MTAQPPRGHPQASSASVSIAARLRQSADWIACAMFATVFVVFNYKIFTRYFEHDEAVWADEVLVILFVWIVFWANAFLLRDKEQITFDLVYRLLPPRAKRAVALARAILIGGIFACALPGSLDYIRFLWREHTPVLNLPLDWVYACFGLFLIAVIARELLAAARLVGPRWRQEI
jgi:TRAP-type C4-dicarboxylate transport system permease small subunit